MELDTGFKSHGVYTAALEMRELSQFETMRPAVNWLDKWKREISPAAALRVTYHFSAEEQRPTPV